MMNEMNVPSDTPRSDLGDLRQDAESASDQVQQRSRAQRIWAGGLFALLYGLGIGGSIWAGISMLAIQTEERRAQFGAGAYPEAESVYGPMLLVFAISLPLVWAWWAWKPARFSGLVLGRVMRLAAVALLISSLVPAVVVWQTGVLALIMSFLFWPLTGLLVALTLWLSDKIWGSTLD